jgi:light-regulated signal transduction histidine kinase (bacteriophytochrome)
VNDDAGASAAPEDDVGELRRALAATQAELAAAIESYKSFAYSVSHDLRAPLRAIGSFAAMLDEDLGEGLPEDARRMLAIVCENAHTMSTQIDALLTLSRLEHRALKPAPVDVRALAESAVADMRAIEPGRDVRVTVGDLPPAHGDAELLRLAFEELVKNAWKFTRDRPSAAVEIGGETRGDEVVYFVRDDGVGFRPDAADRLFTVFRRLHGKEFEGLGLGLALVKGVASRHHGRAWADSEPGVATTFFLALPAPAP